MTSIAQPQPQPRRRLRIIKECSICMETFNNNTNKPVLCEHCPMRVCRSCCERYILEQPMVHCMSVYCNREWSRKYIASQFPNSFIDGRLKEHRKTILFEKEREKFPYTIERMNRLDDIESKLNDYDIDDIYKNIREINKKCDEIQQQYRIQRDKYSKKMRNISKKIQKEMMDDSERQIWNSFVQEYLVIINKMSKREFLTADNFVFPSIPSNMTMSGDKTKIINVWNKMIKSFFNFQTQFDESHKKLVFYINLKDVQEQLYDERNFIWNDIETNRTAAEAEMRNENVNKCPTPDCNGFLNSEWHCILCKVDACSSCREIKSAKEGEEEHKCNPDTVETVKLLQKDTKACPKCHTGIYKIDGCDQMWCVKCHTAFSWRTGAIETKIHNPHYYEWMRSKSANGEIPREAGDANEVDANANEVGCVGEINHNTIERMFDSLKRNYTDKLELREHTSIVNIIDTLTTHMIQCIQIIVHMREVVLDRYSVETDFIDEFNKRCDFLKKKINEKQYKTYLERVAKNKSKNAEVIQLIRLIIDVKSDIIRRVMNLFNNVITTSTATSLSLSSEYSNFDAIVENIQNQITIMKEDDEFEKYVGSIVSDIETTYKNKVNLK